MKYHFDCDCIYPRAEILYMHNIKGTRIKCPVHGEPIKHIIVKCVTCGKEYTAQHASAKHCDECKRTSRMRQQAEYRARNKTPISIKKPRAANGKYYPRKDDCKFYFNCIAVPDGKLLHDPKACQGCKRYRRRDSSMDIMAHVKSGDSITATAQS